MQGEEALEEAKRRRKKKKKKKVIVEGWNEMDAKLRKKLHKWWSDFRARAWKTHNWERTTRYVLFTGISYGFSMTEMPNVPQTFAPLIGVFVTFMMALSDPLVSSVGAIVPGFFLLVFVMWAWLTAMLAAVTVDSFSLGFMFIVCVCGICWLGTLRLGKYGKLTLLIGSMSTYFGMLLLLYMFPVVYEGQAFQLNTNPANSTKIDPSVVNDIGSNFMGSFFNDFTGMIHQIQDILDQHANDPSLEFPIRVDEEVGNGQYAGAELYVEYSPGELTLGIEGGMWFVRGMWTWTNPDNAFALFLNFMSAFCLSVALYVASLLTPPWRTSRSFIRENLSILINSMVEPSSSTGLALQGAKPKEMSKKQANTVRQSIRPFTSPHISAAISSLEPYLLCPGPTVSTWLSLKDVIIASTNLATQAEELTMLRVPKSEACAEDASSQRIHAGDLLLSSSVLMKQGARIVTIEPSGWFPWQDTGVDKHLLKEFSRNLEGFHEEMADQRRRISRGGFWDPGREKLVLNHPEELAFFASMRYGLSVSRLGRRLHQLLNCLEDRKAKNLFYNFIPLLWVPWVTIRRLLYTLNCFFCFWTWIKEKWWKKKQVIWTLKYTLGLSLLVAPSIFSPAFRNFDLGGSTNSSKGWEQVKGQAAGKFGGWFSLAYITTFCITLEGSVHKGALRILGTCFGAFSAWLALVCFEDSIYGLIAWMCVTNFVGFFATTNQHSPLLGTNPAYGYAIHLFSITQAIICISVYRGLGERDELTLSRLVANICGIAMSSIVSAIVPFKTNPMVREIVDSGLFLCMSQTETMLRRVTLVDESDEFGATVERARQFCIANNLDEYAEELRRGRMLVDDASLFPQMRFLSIQESLGPHLIRMSLLHARVTRLHTFLYRLLSDLTAEEKDISSARNMRHRVLSRFQLHQQPTSLSGNDQISLGDMKVQKAVLRFFRSPPFQQVVVDFVEGCNVCLSYVKIGEHPHFYLEPAEGMTSIEEVSQKISMSFVECRVSVLELSRSISGRNGHESVAGGLLIPKLMVFLHELEYCFHFLRGLMEDFYLPRRQESVEMHG